MKAWGANRGDSLGWLSRGDILHYAWHDLLLGRRRYLEIVPAQLGVRVFGVHLSAIHSNPAEWRRTFEARSLLSHIAEYREAFHLVTGDFNTLAPARISIRPNCLVACGRSSGSVAGGCDGGASG